MDKSWVPASAALLVVGAFALLLGSLLTPSTGGDTAATLGVVRDHDARWMAVAGLFLLAAVGLLLGLPSMLVLFPYRGHRLGLAAIAVFAVACAGTAGYAMILSFFRALVLADAVRVEGFDEVASEPGFAAMLYGWVASFYIGELLLAVALLRAALAPRWIPLMLLAHVLLLPFSRALPDSVQSGSTVLVALAFAGLGITANTYAAQGAPAARQARIILRR